MSEANSTEENSRAVFSQTVHCSVNSGLRALGRQPLRQPKSNPDHTSWIRRRSQGVASYDHPVPLVDGRSDLFRGSAGGLGDSRWFQEVSIRNVVGWAMDLAPERRSRVSDTANVSGAKERGATW